MRKVKHTATVRGVEITMLFTPRLFEFKTASMDFSQTESAGKVAGMYADLAYCAALNHWTLEERDVADFELTRVDFHEWAVLEPKEFSKTMVIALEAITNKSLNDILNEQKGQAAEAETDVKKKTSSLIMQKLKRFWSAIVG